MQPLADIAAVKARCDWTLDADEERLAQATLEDLSDDARFHGSQRWLDAETSPRMVSSLVSRATARYLRNPNGYTQSRAGDETLGWTDRAEEGNVAQFTDKEIKMLARMGGNRAILSVPLTAWETSKARVEGLIPDEQGIPIHYFSSDTSPW